MYELICPLSKYFWKRHFMLLMMALLTSTVEELSIILLFLPLNSKSLIVKAAEEQSIFLCISFYPMMVGVFMLMFATIVYK